MFDKHPTWIAMAQDGVGHCYGFTGTPCYHAASKRWILPFGGEAHSMGLARLVNEPETTLIIKDGCEANIRKEQEEFYAQYRAKMGGQPTGSSLNQGNVFGSGAGVGY
jgi:hypothetical protein